MYFLFFGWKPDPQRKNVAVITGPSFQKDNDTAKNKSPDLQDKFAEDDSIYRHVTEFKFNLSPAHFQ